MTDHLLSALQRELTERQAAGLLRKRRVIDSPQAPHLVVDGKEVVSFCSNDYLGLANHPKLVTALSNGAQAAGAGSGAAHLITGHHRYHHELELVLAEFVGLPKALLFSTGYMANVGVIDAFMHRNDDMFADKLNHASLNDGAILSRAVLHRYSQCHMQALERLLQSSTSQRKMVVTDSVFSMDGDIAPLKEILALCERYDAWLYIDDAHGFGVLGEQGRGALQHFSLSSPNIIYMATLGKAAGVSGAFVAGAAPVIDYLMQNARTYIYTTAMPPALAAASLAALELIEQSAERRSHLNKLIEQLKSGLHCKRWQLASSATPIQPLIIGSNDEAVKASECLQQQGILVPAIRPPTVPTNSARLRITLSAAHTSADVDQLITALHHIEERLAS